MCLLVHSLTHDIIISLFLSFSIYLFLWDWRWHCVLQKEPRCLLQPFLLKHLLRWGLTDYLPIRDSQCQCPLLFPEIVGKQGRGHRVQVEDRKKTVILLLLVIELRTSLLSGIRGMNAIFPGWCLDYLANWVRAPGSAGGRRKKKIPLTCRYDLKLVPPARQNFCSEPWALTYPANVNSYLDYSPILFLFHRPATDNQPGLAASVPVKFLPWQFSATTCRWSSLSVLKGGERQWNHTWDATVNCQLTAVVCKMPGEGKFLRP
jgi:hypothetical protein